MSLKDNMDYVKNELSSQEKMLSGVMRLERLYKKYKIAIFGIGLSLILGSLGFYVYNSIQEENRIKSNEIFIKFLENPTDKKLLAELQENSDNLHQIATYLLARQQKKIASINIVYIKELNEFNQAIKQNNIAKLQQLSQNNDFILKEYAIFYRALIVAKQGKNNEAQIILKAIPKNSEINNLANLLRHYLAAQEQ